MTPREKAIESAAKLIYEDMPYSDGQGDKKKPGWIEGGNSLKQDIARLNARVYIDAYLAALEAEGGAKKGGCIIWNENMPDEVWLCDTHIKEKPPAVPVLVIKL